MMDLVEFLRARLGDQTVQVRVLRTIANGIQWRKNLLDLADYLELDVEARHRLVEMHTPETMAAGFGCIYCGERLYCTTLRLLALPYADHPDYRAEWKP